MKNWAIISTALALFFFVLFLRTLSIPSGGGQIKESPSGKLVAIANSLRNKNPLSADSKGVYCEFTVSRSDASPFKRVVVYPLGTNDEMYFRELPEIINWATNSDEVSFSIPRIVLKLSVSNSP